MNPKLQIEDNKVALANLEALLGNVSKALSMALLGGDLSAVDQAFERLQLAQRAFDDWHTHAFSILHDRREALLFGLESKPPKRPAASVTGGKKSAAPRQEDLVEPRPAKGPAGTKAGGKKSL